jgi:hypothetical protein
LIHGRKDASRSNSVVQLTREQWIAVAISETIPWSPTRGEAELQMNEKQQFQTILRFLESRNEEVGGRMVSAVDPEFDVRLKRLAAGKLDEKSRDLILEELAKDPGAVSRLAQYLSGEA